PRRDALAALISSRFAGRVGLNRRLFSPIFRDTAMPRFRGKFPPSGRHSLTLTSVSVPAWHWQSSWWTRTSLRNQPTSSSVISCAIPGDGLWWSRPRRIAPLRGSCKVRSYGLRRVCNPSKFWLIRRERVRAELSFGRKSAPRPTNFNKHKLQPLHALLVLLSHS